VARENTHQGKEKSKEYTSLKTGHSSCPCPQISLLSDRPIPPQHKTPLLDTLFWFVSGSLDLSLSQIFLRALSKSVKPMYACVTCTQSVVPFLLPRHSFFLYFMFLFSGDFNLITTTQFVFCVCPGPVKSVQWNYSSLTFDFHLDTSLPLRLLPQKLGKKFEKRKKALSSYPDTRPDICA
jgi:hypothetical protein